ncbi:MAG: FAD-dependent monooxygenase [Fusobacteriaceae bacterium]|jgi:flavin-dependent dehydrogenase|nr:FAD-dependent monooxygenase [Fusobacteriaceae bacterium]
MEKYDIVVIGGGPAGAAFSYFIDPKYNVLLLEKRNYGKDTLHKKSCGGLLNETAQSLLSALGYGLPVDILVNPQVFHVRILDWDNNLSKKYYKGYLNIDREKLDNFLLSRSERENKGLTVRRGAVYHDFQRINKGAYRIKYRMDGILKYAETRLVIGADGANSRVAAEIVPNIQNDYISIQRRYKKCREMREFYAILDRSVNDYYSWVIPKEDEILLGSILRKDGNPRERFDLLEAKLREKESVIGDFLTEEGAFIKRPGWKAPFVGHGNFGLIGEAAGFISPSSSEGISYALKSGYLLAKHLNRYGSETGINRYESSCAGLIRNIRVKYLKSKLLYTPWTRNLLIRSGIHAEEAL